jgi:hypothetical protein
MILGIQLLGSDGGVRPEQDLSELSWTEYLFDFRVGVWKGFLYGDTARYMIWMTDGRFWSIVECG